MSKFMLDDDDAINDVNPFVEHDFSFQGVCDRRVILVILSR